MRLHIRHETSYRYARPVSHTVQLLRLTPRRDPSQRTFRWALSTEGDRFEQLDAYGNISHLVTIEEPVSAVRIVATGVVDTEEVGGWIGPDETGLSPYAYLATTPLTCADATIRAMADSVREPMDSPAGLFALAEVVRGGVLYQPGVTEVTNAASEVVALGRGVCQDHAHVYLACARSRGVAARYVSGYFAGGDEVVASHAWVDVWLGEERGWFSIDVTHGMASSAGHCRLAVGRDYLDASPVRGVRRGGGDEQMQVNVAVNVATVQQ